MRHGDKINNLSRKSGHRVALMKNLAAALIIHKRITTTVAKAKALRVYIEPLITKSKDNTTHSRRLAFSYLQDKNAARELFDVIGLAVADRPGGYVRIIRTGFRRGDAADMAMIELVDFNETYKESLAEGQATRKKTRRSGAARKASAATAIAPSIATAPVVEEVAPIADVIEEELPVADVIEDVTPDVVEDTTADDVATSTDEKTEEA